MQDKSSETLEIEKELKQISENGIQADRRRLKEDMCAQFSDYREWIREYVVNAFDARAKHCWISGRDNGETITIVVEDDGHGMDKKGIMNFNTIYRSVKTNTDQMTIGRHGIGKLSVAAIPGQCGFQMFTSTRKESWRVEAGCLLDDKPIKLEKVEPVRQQGTCFNITFKKSVNLRHELHKLGNVLDTYVRYLPLNIIVFERINDGDDSPELPRVIQGTWSAENEKFGRSYTYERSGNRFEVIIGIGNGYHEIYQSRVLISKKYNLLFHDLSTDHKVPHVSIRVDSPDFELPFGRHRLSNEGALGLLTHHLRKNILPQYVGDICRLYQTDLLSDYGIHAFQVEDIVCALAAYSSDRNHIWCNTPVFSAWNRPRVSLNELRTIAEEKDVLYLENSDAAGMDYSVFEAPVLLHKQPEGGIALLLQVFKKNLVNLNMENVVFESPQGKGPNIGPREKRFQRFLGFHPDSFQVAMNKQKENEPQKEILQKTISQEKLQQIAGICEEYYHANEELSRMKWRVNYLVKSDGKTPCHSHRFLPKNETVVLNLYHPEIQQLLALSDKAPALAGHWAMAICLNDTNRILPHLTPEAREELILIDAIIKSAVTDPPVSGDSEEKQVAGNDRNWWEFLRKIDDIAMGLN